MDTTILPFTTRAATPPSTSSTLSKSMSPEGKKPLSSSLAMEHSPIFNAKLKMVVYAAGTTLFNVPHYGATHDAREFENKLYQSETLFGPGSHDHCPIVLDPSVSATDFTLFLQTLYPGTGVGPVTMDDWFTVLRLCNLWTLVSLRVRAVRELEKFRTALVSGVDKLVLGQKHGIPKWVKEGCSVLTYHDEDLSSTEEDKLDVDTLVKVLKLRNKRLTWTLHSVTALVSSYTMVKEPKFNFHEAFKTVFGVQANDDADLQISLSASTLGQ